MSASPKPNASSRRHAAAVSSRRSIHDEAVVQAEVRRLASALKPFGAMRKETLKHESGAEHWHAGSFEEAVAEAVDDGAIRPLGMGFFALPPSRDAAHTETHDEPRTEPFSVDDFGL